MEELAKTYDPHQTEERIYELWEKSGAFSPDKQLTTNDQRPFTIVIPPPNVTGSLHMGHALNNTIQDILIRRSRMRGIPTLWVPGTDHAGIATQNVVEKKLAKEGRSRKELGREKFEAEIHQWVDEYGHIIIDQLKKLGCSCDFSRQRFTMDDDYAEAVKTAFLHYYEKGLIYQGERVINWCIHCQTALSDIEVEHKEVEGKLWFIKYGDITVATTRPETMLGDTAVAVNPSDKRYQDLVGQKVILPLTNREIPIIADESVDPKFGTGAVKVTPAHDPNDFGIGERHQLERIKVIDETGKITQLTPLGCKFTGQKVLEARENIIKDLESQGLIEKVQDYTHQVPHCYRCGRQVEQLMSKQWFLKMKELIKPAIAAVEKDEIKFTPTRWKRVSLDWMKNIQDWCISRQIWWGHRLPVFVKREECKMQNAKCKINEDYYIGDNPPEGYKQIDDVLDTWFSSALWPFATLGWPQDSKDVIANKAKQSYNQIAASPSAPRNDTVNDLDYFYPTTTLSTARDILYLWVARMIFSGYEFMGKKPFDTVYIHPTIFNIEGKRMSKSLGTGIDPLELIEKYGADATRFGLTYINTGIQDIKFDENAILAGQKFANKIWNIARFVLQNATVIASEAPLGIQQSIKTAAATPRSDNDKKILDSLNSLIISVNSDLGNFRFGQAAHDLYDFIWHDFADIYIEKCKVQNANGKIDENTQDILLYVLTTSLKLLHPMMPFLTESIWQTLLAQNLVKEKMLINASWPEK